MTLGIAVFILGCLYFYFKEAGFRKAVHITGKVLGVLVLLMGLGIGVYYLNAWHVERVQAAQQAQEEAQYQAKQAKEAAEAAKVCTDWEAKHPIGSPLDTVNIPDGAYAGTAVEGPMPQCTGPLEDAYNDKEEAYINQNKAKKKTKRTTPPWKEHYLAPDNNPTKVPLPSTAGWWDFSSTASTLVCSFSSNGVPKGIELGWVRSVDGGAFSAKVAEKLGDDGWHSGKALPNHSTIEQAKHEVEQNANAALCTQ